MQQGAAHSHASMSAGHVVRGADATMQLRAEHWTGTWFNPAAPMAYTIQGCSWKLEPEGGCHAPGLLVAPGGRRPREWTSPNAGAGYGPPTGL